MFVTLEGPEGAGKSSVIKEIGAYFEQQGERVVLTREPGAGSLGQSLRQILLDGAAIDPRAELMLFLADRAQHVSEIIRPALAEGWFVLCDRYSDSTLAYQGYGRDFELGLLKELNFFATNGLVPDLTLLLDLPVEIGLGRVVHKDRLDSEPTSFHEKVRQGFLTEARADPGRWRVVDASKPLADVTAHAIEVVKERQAQRK